MPGVDEGTRTRASRAARRADAGVEGNARLTAVNAALLLVLLAAEGVTILGVRRMLSQARAARLAASRSSRRHWR
jgi:hypothetical protein